MRLPQRLRVLSIMIFPADRYRFDDEMYKSSLQSCSCWFGRVFVGSLVTLQSGVFLEGAMFCSALPWHECPRAMAEGAAASRGSAAGGQGRHTEIAALWARCWGRGTIALLNEVHGWPQLQQMGLCGVHSGVCFQSSVDWH